MAFHGRNPWTGKSLGCGRQTEGPETRLCSSAVGKRTGALLCIYIPVNVYITMEHHHFLLVIQRTKWQFSIAMLVDQRVFVVVFNFLKSLASTCMYLYIYIYMHVSQEPGWNELA